MTVILRSRLRGFSRIRLAAAVDTAMRRLGVGRAELSLVVVGERAMRSANRRFFGKSSPTDVISISQLDGEPFPAAGRPGQPLSGPKCRRLRRRPEKWLGDVIVSFDAAKSQAAEEGHSIQTELSVLAVHGILHNLGMNDATPRQRRTMMRKTLRILR